jgi:hypothetical protein
VKELDLAVLSQTLSLDQSAALSVRSVTLAGRVVICLPEARVVNHHVPVAMATVMAIATDGGEREHGQYRHKHESHHGRHLLVSEPPGIARIPAFTLRHAAATEDRTQPESPGACPNRMPRAGAMAFMLRIARDAESGPKDDQ